MHEDESRRLWQVVRRELSLHPPLQAADLYKLIVQAVFGIDHWLEQPDGLMSGLLAEWASLCPADFGRTPTLQLIDPDGRTARLHLGPLKARGVDPSLVCEVVARQQPKRGRRTRFRNLWGQLVCLAAEGRLPLAADELERYRGLSAVPRHSPAYGPAAYRVLNDVRAPETWAGIRRLGMGLR